MFLSPQANLVLSLSVPGNDGAHDCLETLENQKGNLATGAPVLLYCEMSGKIMLEVNAASNCANTLHHERLEKIYV